MDTSESIMQFTQAVAKNALPFLTAVAAIGTLSMAIIQAFKESFPARAWFNKPYLRGWLAKKAAKAAPVKDLPPPSADAAHEDLIRLATAGDAEALHDLSMEQLCGQAQAAAQVVLDYPDKHSDLLRCLASLATAEDIEELLKKPGTGDKRTDAQVEARGRVLHQVQRSIDGLQIAGGYAWTTRLQWISFGLSFGLTLAGMLLYSGPFSGRSGIKFFAIAAAAGVLAPTARDLVAALEKLRK